MKKVILIITTLFLTTLPAWALDLTKAPELEQAFSDSLELSWENVEGAIAYIVYYGTQPKDDQDGYQSVTSDFIDQSKYTLKGLNPSTKYYIAIKALDENAIEWDFSPEAQFETKPSGSTSKLAVQDLQVLNKNEFRLSFTNSLNVAVSWDFKIEDITNGLNIDVVSSKIIGDSVDIQVQQSILPSTKYELTVITIEDSDGKSIESGVDGIISITTPNVIPEQWNDEEVTIIEDNTDTQQMEPQEEIPELNSWMAEEQVEINENIAGQNIEVATMKQNDSKLPQTGPEHIILVILSLLVWFVVYMYVRKNQEI